MLWFYNILKACRVLQVLFVWNLRLHVHIFNFLVCDDMQGHYSDKRKWAWIHYVISAKINIQRSPQMIAQRELLVEVSADRNKCCDSSHGAICCTQKSNDMPQPGSLQWKQNQGISMFQLCFNQGRFRKKNLSSLLSTWLVSQAKWNVHSSILSCCAKIQESTLIWHGLRHMSHTGLEVDGHLEYIEATRGFSIPGWESEKSTLHFAPQKHKPVQWNVQPWWCQETHKQVALNFYFMGITWKVSSYIPNIEMSGNKLGKLYK